MIPHVFLVETERDFPNSITVSFSKEYTIRHLDDHLSLYATKVGRVLEDPYDAYCIKLYTQPNRDIPR